MSIQELYEQAIKPLPPVERLQLATIILTNIPPECVVDYSSEWTDEDMADFTRAAWKRTDTDPELAYDG
jgi:hypothetical protein